MVQRAAQGYEALEHNIAHSKDGRTKPAEEIDIKYSGLKQPPVQYEKYSSVDIERLQKAAKATSFRGISGSRSEISKESQSTKAYGAATERGTVIRSRFQRYLPDLSLACDRNTKDKTTKPPYTCMT